MTQNRAHIFLALCLALLSPIQGQEFEEEMPSPRLNCPEGANGYGSYCYYYIEDRLSWSDADLFCQNMNSGHLVSVLSLAESNFVASLIKESGRRDTYVWTGLHDPKKNRRFHWSSGSLFVYKSWASGAPSSSNPGYCVAMTSATNYKSWKDENCDTAYSFVCKFKS